MTTPAAADLKPARLRLWSNWLWILAASLALAVLWSAARLIHDQKIRQDALRSLAQDKASEIANLGAAKFTLLLNEALGPAWSPTARRADIVQVLVQGQRDRLACGCRETLPIKTFFRFDASRAAPLDGSTQRLDVASVDAKEHLADSTLVRIATAQWNEGIKLKRPLTGVELARGHAVLTVTRPSDGGGGTDIYGAIVPIAGLAQVLFGAIPLETPTPGISPRGVKGPPVFMHNGPAAAMHAAHVAEHRRLVQLDTFGLGVAADTQAVFGSLAERPFMATATLPPPLQKFHVNVAMMGSQVALPLVMPFSHDRLWLNGILILATFIVCLFAIGASRREVALARARSDFVAGVSHDLRMPLAQILLASETLSLGRDRNETERSTLNGSILREARRLKSMIDNVLLFSRSGAVGIEPHLQRVGVRALLDSVAESLALAVADAGQSIEIAASPELEVVADRALIHQALANLVDNAMKYGPRGQRIRLFADPVADGIAIVVEDDGPGIPPSARERLFEAYERLARDSTSERTGSGLGLAVVRQIVLACRGTVRIDDFGKGARVVITLPTA